jgi:hypothetical protein
MPDSREVNALRKEGNLVEALAMAREVISTDANDIWNIRAYGWAIHDSLKDALEHDKDKARELLAEFKNLNLPEDEDLLIKRREYFSNLDDPLFQLLQTAKTKSKNKEYTESIRLYRSAVQKSPQSRDACEGLAWELWRILKDSNEEGHTNQFDGILREYAILKAVPKPSDIHSRILATVTWNASKVSDYIAFIKWWDLGNLQRADHQPQVSSKDGKTYDSTVERVIKALNQAGKKHTDISDFEWISSFIGENYEKYPHQEWFPYYYGKALSKTDDKLAARNILLPIVRAKQSEFWAWDVLASTYSEPEIQIACLCASLLCKVKMDSYRVNVHSELGGILLEQELLTEAKLEYMLAIDIYKNEEWKMPQELATVQEENWFEKTDAAESNTDFYSEHAVNAHEILVSSLPWIDAVISGKLDAREGKKELVFVGTIVGQTIEETPISPSKFLIVDGLAIGSPIKIKTDQFGEKTIVVAIEQREGEEWDILPSIGGVVKHINNEKGVVHVTTSSSDFCLVHLNRLPEAKSLKVGMFVGVKVTKDKKYNINHAVEFHTIDELPPSSNFYQSFDGEIRINEGRAYGFINDCYVPPFLIKKHSLVDGVHVSGFSVCEWNASKGKSTWSVVEITSTTDS